MADTIEFDGATYKLACTPPPAGFQCGIPPLSAAGFRTWTDDEIMGFLRTKAPRQRRLQFGGEVVDQGQVGSCNAAATTQALVKAMRLTGAGAVPRLNWEFLYSLINRGVDQGSHLSESARAVRDVGVCPWKDRHQFNRHIFANHFTPEDTRDAADYKAGSIFRITTWQELATLTLSGQGAAVVAVHVGSNFNSLDGAGYAGASSGPGNHAVQVCDVDLVNGRVAFDMENSWSKRWGQGGYCYLDWDRHLAPTVRIHDFFAILSANAKPFEGVPAVVI